MRGATCVLVAIGAWFAFAGVSLACDPVIDPNARDAKLTTLPDCGFSDGGADDTSSGAPVVDIGGGRIGQKLSTDLYCGMTERLMFVDCERAEVIVLEGGYIDHSGGVPNSSIALIQRPQGPIRLRSSTTVAELAVVADGADIAYTLNIFAELNRERPRNRFDPFCGCKLFYPDSAGAQN